MCHGEFAVAFDPVGEAGLTEQVAVALGADADKVNHVIQEAVRMYSL